MQEDLVKLMITKFMDDMLPRTKITLDDLVAYAFDVINIKTNKTQVYGWVRDVAKNRQDFTIYRGKGCVKNVGTI